MVASLQCHEDVRICRVCVGWLRQRAGGVDVTPTLPVRDIDEASRFTAAGLPVTPVQDMPWGMHEFHPDRPERQQHPRRPHDRNGGVRMISGPAGSAAGCLGAPRRAWA